MWLGHFKIWHKNCIYLSNATKYNVVISMYPLNSYVEGKWRFHTNINILTGKKEDIERFIKAVKKDPRTMEFKGNGNVYLSHMRFKADDYHTTNYYTPKIFLLKPIVHKNGKEDWYFGAWDKEIINEMFHVFKKHFHIEVHSIKEEDFTDIFMPQVMPKMTEKQKQALRLAIKEGYYNFPKKIYLQDLAKRMNVSRVTFEEHLRKAEAKLLPGIFGEGFNET